MDYLTIQSLEYRPELAVLSPEAVRACLVRAADRLPLTHLLLGWDLPPVLLDACQHEAQRLGIKLYRWHPLLTGAGVFQPRPEWQTVGATGERIAGFQGMPEFTFVCPNHPDGKAAIRAHLDDILASGIYAGLFIGHIRFPSPAGNPITEMGCFCNYCQVESARQGIDLEWARRRLLEPGYIPGARQELIENLFRPLDPLMQDFYFFRQNSISSLLAEVARRTHAAGLEVGLDCFAPSLTRMVGLDLAALGQEVDWIKIMGYSHTLGPAGLPFELGRLAGWLLETTSMSERQVMAFLAQVSGLPLPGDRAALINPGLSSVALMVDVKRGVNATKTPILAGIELVEISGVTHLDPLRLKEDLQAVRQAGAAGVSLSWDLWWMPEKYLDLAGIMLSS